jgi:Predicted metal-dependent hydrolase of the TIM-barrel fold
LPYLIDRMDNEYLDQYRDIKMKLLPSEYWRRQCRATFQYDRIGTKLIEDMGVETLMWGSDYPHPDGIWPDSSEYIAKQFGHLPADVTHKITCENAGKFYGLIELVWHTDESGSPGDSFASGRTTGPAHRLLGVVRSRIGDRAP